MYLCLTITIDRVRSTLLITVNTSAHACILLRMLVKLSNLCIVLMRHTMFVNIQYYFLSLDLIPKWPNREIGYILTFELLKDIKLLAAITHDDCSCTST